MANLDFLTDKHEEFVAREAEWIREERRLYGADAVLKDPLELPMWAGEDGTHYLARKSEAQLIPLPEIHASMIAGHIGRVRQELSYGGLGDRREREQIKGPPNPAELIHYNINTRGSDGTEWPAWTDGVQTRAIATGHRWVMVEAPAQAPVSLEDWIRGLRPWAVEDSPLAWPIWDGGDGTIGDPLNWAVKRARVDRRRMVGGEWKKPDATQLGFYLVVRRGVTALGPDFEKGGWWLFDGEQKQVGYGAWDKTRGEIPLFRLVGDDSQGAPGYPASSRSLTAPLGSIAVSLMRRISHRNYDADDAAKSLKFILGTKHDAPELFNHTVQMMAESLVAPVHAYETSKGMPVVPQVYDSSMGAVPAEVFSTIIDSTIAIAKEIMLRQVTEPQASGTSRELAFAGAVSPLLGKLAARRQAFENTLIYFFELRGGVEKPSGSATFKREVPLQPIIDDIDRMIKTMQQLGVKSPTLATHLAMNAGHELGRIPDAIRATVEAEIKASAQSAAELEDADTALIDAIRGGGTRPRGTRGAPNTNGNAGGGTADNGAGGNEGRTGDDASRSTERTSDEGGEGGAGNEAVAQQLEAVQSSVTSLAAAVQALSEQLKAAQQPSAPIVIPIAMQNGAGKRVEMTGPDGKKYTAVIEPIASE